MAVSTIDPNGLNIGQIGGRRNLLINSDMVIDQRNSGSSVSNNAYIVDRFLLFRDGTAVTLTGQQSSTAPVGFNNSIVMTTTSSGTPGASEHVGVRHTIEGYNFAHLNYGTSDAKSCTLSFYVRSSLTGTFSGSITNGAFNRSYPYTYTINAANTWEYKTVTIPGDTTGTWLTTNGIGARVYWNLGSGSSVVGTAGSWTGYGLTGATGSVSLVGTNSATLYLTGVQLEVGDVATPFEHRSVGEELSACQRYYYSNINNGSGRVQFDTYVTTGIFPAINLTHPTTMRANPSVTKIGSWTGSNINSATLGFSANITNILIQADYSGTGRGYLYADTNGGFSCDAEL